MRPLVFLLAADTDIQKAFELYEGFQEGRGALFMRRLDAALEQLRAFPESGPLVHGRYRRLLVPQFPFGIFYTIEPRGVIIIGVMDIRQDPEAVRRRLA